MKKEAAKVQIKDEVKSDTKKAKRIKSKVVNSVRMSAGKDLGERKECSSPTR